MDSIKTRLYCRDLSKNITQTITGKDYSISIKHPVKDPPNVNRINCVVSGIIIEILPTKGFSVGQICKNNNPVLWEPPIGLCDPDVLDLYSDEIAINGDPSPGFTFLKTFASGIELYGLRNWGMPRFDEEKNFFHPLHGEMSNIPVEFFDVEINSTEVILEAIIIYREFPVKPKEKWFKEGEILFEVRRKIIINRNTAQIIIKDDIKNVSDVKRKPDWGYHITFLPENGSRLLVPSLLVENRSKEKVPTDFEKWTPATNNNIRKETGIIHKSLKTKHTDQGNMSYAFINHPNRNGVKISFPVSPYFQTWFCKGGANSMEFTRVSDGQPLFIKNWDGFGLEIGASALDHNGNTDPAVPEQTDLKSGESVSIHLVIEFIEDQENIINEMENYNKKRLIT